MQTVCVEGGMHSLELFRASEGISSENPMDKWQTTSRVEEIRREILQIREANRDYKANRIHTTSEIAKHGERQRRLQEIMEELKGLSGRSTDATS